jgi:hypothetical protein
MVENEITGVCFLSGDAHMLAADDGRNNRYGKGGTGGFPEFAAAPLDRQAEPRGGPWLKGPVLNLPEEGFFGLVDVNDDGRRVGVHFRGLNQNGDEKMALEFELATEANELR